MAAAAADTLNAALVAVLANAGFSRDPRMQKAQQDSAAKDGMSKNGGYVIEAVWTKGIVTLSFEQNTSPSPAGDGLTALVTHPCVCVISSSKGRVAVNPTDTDLLLHIAAELS